MTIVFVWGEPVVNTSILPLLYSDTPLPKWCDGMGYHCLQYSVTPSTDPWHHDSPAGVTRLRTVTTLPWPARFPDLSPIELIWDNLGRRTLNILKDASPLGRLVKREGRYQAPDHLQGVLSQNWSGTEPNCSVICMVLKATANVKHTTNPFAFMNFLGLDLMTSNNNTLYRNQARKGYYVFCFEYLNGN
ncbi:hypothetical protein TNCV_2720501 [Trichonephila clavipes]|nr:hypothetical protein TNCV_2720501 [Trichonephila clavipes]